MFSRAERAFLERVAHGPRASVRGALESQFPNPVYRRKLMWGIRRKASRSMADWQLYWAAAEQDERLLPREGSGEPSPLFADPLVTLVEEFHRVWARGRRRGTSSDRLPTPKRG